MKLETLTASRNPLKSVLIAGAVLAAIAIGFALGMGSVLWTNRLILAVQAVLLVILGFLVLRRPYWGVILTVSSLPLLDLLPPIPYATSLISVLGGVTLVSYLFNWRSIQADNRDARFQGVHLLGLVFIFWILATNPEAAFLGPTRNWVFTFIQLWILAWLGGELLSTPRKHRLLMWVYAASAAVSALFILQQIGFDPESSLIVRPAGLARGANSASRYFIVALIFLAYLRTTLSTSFHKITTAAVMVILTLGVFFTFSRTGILLLTGLAGIMVLQREGGERGKPVLLILVAAAVVVQVFAEDLLRAFFSAFPAVLEGTGTVGLRYDLWRAGLRMWRNNPLLGIGIGQYPQQLYRYGADLIPQRFLQLGAHNMYIQVLAETGAAGFLVFLAMLVVAFRNFRRSARSADPHVASIASTWFVVFLLLLLGGVTKGDHFDKLVWLAVGLSAWRSPNR